MLEQLLLFAHRAALASEQNTRQALRSVSRTARAIASTRVLIAETITAIQRAERLRRDY